MRLMFRGGRTWILDHGRRAVRRLRRQDIALAGGLKAAHRILDRGDLNPASSAISPQAKAPASAYDRKICALAMLAPAIQRMILEGRQPGGLNLQLLINATPPLAWADQEAWLEDLARDSPAR
jgi:hypothetical protein